MHEIISDFGFLHYLQYVSLPILTISNKSESWSPGPVRFAWNTPYIVTKMNTAIKVLKFVTSGR